MASARLRCYLLTSVLLWAAMQLAAGQTRPSAATDVQRNNSTCLTAKNSCSDCIQMKGCVWCIPKTITDTVVAVCQSEGTPCDSGNGHVENDKGKATGPGNGVSANDPYNMALTTDISRLSLRVGEPMKVEMTLMVSADGLLDLYYLTDLSRSMENDLDTLKKGFGEDLVNAMENKTNNFRIGFGTFIDKKMLPYFDINNNNKRVPQPADACQNSYSFCNSMPLTEDGKVDFLNILSRTTVGDNNDITEGGLDALMQVLVCEKAIGWRENALKIILYASESTFHYSGDGKLAGIDKLNDGSCHLDSKNRYYTAGTTQDYPSVAQIGEAAKKNNIHVIFAVADEVLVMYKMLAEHVQGSSFTQLANDSSNIIKIVTEEFEEISKSLELKAESSEEVGVSFQYDCPSGAPSKCEGLEKGHNYTVTAEITLLRCPVDGSSTSRRVVLDAVGLHESVTIDLDYICSCNCEKPENSVVNSPKCNNTGTYTCGVCECPDNVYGTTCACDGNVQDNSEICTVPGQLAPCSGQGQCMCRSCECNNGYYGKFCECADKGCPLHAGKECNGHGDCKCMKCQCHSGWTGDTCNCSTENTQCFRKGSPDQCSGHGVCECNSCKCDYTGHGDDKYFGKYCHDCPTCGGECSKLATCVQCHLFEQKDKVKTGVDEAICEKNQAECVGANIKLVAEESQVNTSIYSKCQMQNDGCTRYFFYRKQTDGTQVVLVGDWYCPMKWWEILLSVVVPMVVIGLLTLLIWYFIHERNLKLAMEKFDKDAAAAFAYAARENELYRNPVSQMQNPLFGKAL